MTISCLLLYGSRARGDHRPSSDVDLLGITKTGRPQKGGSYNGNNLHLLPLSLVQADANCGDLFILHLISEAKALYDPENILRGLSHRFRVKSSYEKDILEASAVAAYCIKTSSTLDNIWIRNRLSWAIRTILIARSAEKGERNFSSHALSQFANWPELKFILDHRDTIALEKLSSACRSICKAHGKPTFSCDGASDNLQLSSFGKIAAATPEYIRSGKSIPFGFEGYI